MAKKKGSVNIYKDEIIKSINSVVMLELFDLEKIVMKGMIITCSDAVNHKAQTNKDLPGWVEMSSSDQKECEEIFKKYLKELLTFLHNEMKNFKGK